MSRRFADPERNSSDHQELQPRRGNEIDVDEEQPTSTLPKFWLVVAASFCSFGACPLVALLCVKDIAMRRLIAGGGWLGAGLAWLLATVIAFVVWLAEGNDPRAHSVRMVPSGYAVAVCGVVAFAVSPLGIYRGYRAWYRATGRVRAYAYEDVFLVALVIFILTVAFAVVMIGKFVEALTFSM